MKNDSPIRVLQVFARMDRGGAETMIMNVYRHIDRSKVQFDFIVHTEDHCDYDEEIKKLGGKIFYIHRYTGKNHFQYKNEWKTFFKNHPEYHIIHGHVRSTAAIYLKIANQFGLVTIAHSHSTSSGKGIAAVVKNIMQFPIRYEADYLFACSKKAGEWLYGKKAPQKENFFVIKNGIEVEKYQFNPITRQRAREEFGIKDSQLVVGHVGNFTYPKNHEFLVDIFNEIHQEKPNSVLLLVGDGELKEKIEQKVAEYKLQDSVIFTGVRDDVPDLMQAMDVFVFPSHFEGFGIALIEAQMSGLLCYASSEGVPYETRITNLVDYISLKDNAFIWADNILRNKKTNSRTEKIKTYMYDAKKNAKWIGLFYERVNIK